MKIEIASNKYNEQVITLTFDELGARGVLILEETAYGLSVRTPERNLGMFDLFYASPEWSDSGASDETQPAVQFVIDDDNPESDEYIGRVRYFSGKTIIEKE